MAINGTQTELLTCDAPDIGDRTEIWSSTITVGNVREIGGSVLAYGYRGGFGGALSGTPSFEFDGRTVTVTEISADRTGDIRLDADIDFDRATDQEFIGERGLPTLERLRLHVCDRTLKLNNAERQSNGVKWHGGFEQFVNWSVTASIVATLSDRPANAPATGRPTLTGTAPSEQVLEASLGNIADGNGLPDTFPGDYSFQWVRADDEGNETEVGTNSATYTVGATDVFGTLKVRVSFVDDDGYEETRVSSPTGRIPAGETICANVPPNSSRQIWRGTLSIGESSLDRGEIPGVVRSKRRGYAVPWLSGDETFGALSKTSFTYGGERYTIEGLTHASSARNSIVSSLAVSLDLDRGFPGDVWRRVHLHICDEAFDYSSRASQDGYDYGAYAWHMQQPLWGRANILSRSSASPEEWDAWVAMPPMLNWPVDRSVELALSIAPPGGTATQEEATPFTAHFEEVPASHDGSSAFELKLVFSGAVFDGSEAFGENQAVKDALEVSGGTIGNPRRVDPGAFDAWWVPVRPSGDGAVSVSHVPTSRTAPTRARSARRTGARSRSRS